jgi:hypothetical protein
VQMRPPRYATFAIGPYIVSAKILPRRMPSHDGPDSPHYMDPGHPPVLESFRVFKDSVEQMELDSAELESIRARVCQLGGVPVLEPAVSPPFRPALFSVRQRGQGFLDWRES